MKYLNKIINKLKSRNVELIGCTKEQVKEIEEAAGNKLPKCYLEFLESMGRYMDEDKNKPDYYDYGNFVGTTVFYPSIKWLTESVKEELTDEGSDLELPENAFVFYDSQGILNAFFKLDEGENPPVYGYEEGYEGNSFPKIADSLSSFYERHLEGDKTLFKELRD